MDPERQPGALPRAFVCVRACRLTHAPQEQNPPFVNSISYGSLSNEDPKNDMEAFNTAACKAGLRGITIVVATGDDGCGGALAHSRAHARLTQRTVWPTFRLATTRARAALTRRTRRRRRL